MIVMDCWNLFLNSSLNLLGTSLAKLLDCRLELHNQMLLRPVTRWYRAHSSIHFVNSWKISEDTVVLNHHLCSDWYRQADLKLCNTTNPRYTSSSSSEHEVGSFVSAVCSKGSALYIARMRLPFSVHQDSASVLLKISRLHENEFLIIIVWESFEENQSLILAWHVAAHMMEQSLLCRTRISWWEPHHKEEEDAYTTTATEQVHGEYLNRMRLRALQPLDKAMNVTNTPSSTWENHSVPGEDCSICCAMPFEALVSSLTLTAFGPPWLPFFPWFQHCAQSLLCRQTIERGNSWAQSCLPFFLFPPHFAPVESQ